jgi:hypothetical protein
MLATAAAVPRCSRPPCTPHPRVRHLTLLLLLPPPALLCPLQDEVLIAGFGRRGHAVGDIPGVRFKVRGQRGWGEAAVGVGGCHGWCLWVW